LTASQRRIILAKHTFASKRLVYNRSMHAVATCQWAAKARAAALDSKLVLVHGDPIPPTDAFKSAA
jgi:hypothetical protein